MERNKYSNNSRIRKSMKKRLVFCLLTLMLLSAFVVNGEPETQIGDVSYTLNFPKHEYYDYGESSKIQIQVQNCTGLFMTDSEVDCRIQVYNNSGSIVLEDNMNFSAPYNFYYDLPDGISKNPAIYPYDIYCNSTCCGGFAAASFKISEGGGAKAVEYPISLSITMGLFLMFVIFLAAYFTIQKHPLSYLFMMLAFILADVSIWLNWRVMSYNLSPLADVFWILFFSFALITVVMFFVVMLDVTRLVIQMNERKKAKENIARFGYA